jgi:EmrB/QacA subfamily drug resistance transporter
MTQGTGMAIVVSAFPAGERGKAIGLIMTMVGTGAVAGPAVGGVLVDALGWRYVFFLNVPLVLLGVAASLTILQGGPAARLRRFDWIGAALSATVLVALLLVISNGYKIGWYSPVILTGAAVVMSLLASFIWWELRTSDPMLDLRLFQRRTFSLGSSSAFLAFFGSSGVLFLMPFYLQGVLGYSTVKSGLVVVPAALCMAVLGPISGRLSDRYGWRPFTVGGLALSVTGMFLFSQVTVDSSLALVMPALILHSSGNGVFYSPNSSSIISAVGQEHFGVIMGLLSLIRNAANVTSVAGATAVVAVTMGSLGYEPSLEAVRAGGAGVGEAFTQGLRYTFMGMMGILTLAMVVSAFTFQPAQRVTSPAAA